ncbi:MAG: hypothetical protein ABRQ39_11975 [Candidatus Eremiobacterota bacterium]
MKRMLLIVIVVLYLFHVTEICAKNPTVSADPPVNPVMPSVPTIPDRSDMPQMPTMKPFPTIKPFPTMKSVPTAKPTKKSGTSSELAPYGDEKKPDNPSGLEPYGEEPVTPSGGTSHTDALVPFGETPSTDTPPVRKTEPPSVVEPYEQETPAPGKPKSTPAQEEEVVPFEPDSSPDTDTGQTGEVAPYEPDSSGKTTITPAGSDANALTSDANSADMSPTPEMQGTAGAREQGKGIKALKEIPLEFYIGAAVMIIFPVLIYFLSRKKKN